MCKPATKQAHRRQALPAVDEIGWKACLADRSGGRYAKAGSSYLSAMGSSRHIANNGA
jgi:hypothetical protein